MMDRRTFVTVLLIGTLQLVLLFATTGVNAQAAAPEFKRVRTQFIAALGDPTSSSGKEANYWGSWEVDPGPRGVYLHDYDDIIVKNGFQGPDGWQFDVNDWWVEEHGLIMPPPSFPIQPGRYLVTGGREVTAVLTIDENSGWSLKNNNIDSSSSSTLYDVTHLPCRSARYTPNTSSGGSPRTAHPSDFPVRPGSEMPNVVGCDKQDYAVLFVIGLEDEQSVLESTRDL
jgi:hypothetical protein